MKSEERSNIDWKAAGEHLSQTLEMRYATTYQKWDKSKPTSEAEYRKLVNELEAALRDEEQLCILVGGIGVGKSFTAYAISKRLEREYQVVYLPLAFACFPDPDSKDQWDLCDLAKYLYTESYGELPLRPKSNDNTKPKPILFILDDVLLSNPEQSDANAIIKNVVNKHQDAQKGDEHGENVTGDRILLIVHNLEEEPSTFSFAVAEPPSLIIYREFVLKDIEASDENDDKIPGNRNKKVIDKIDWPMSFRLYKAIYGIGSRHKVGAAKLDVFSIAYKIKESSWRHGNNSEEIRTAYRMFARDMQECRGNNKDITIYRWDLEPPLGSEGHYPNLLTYEIEPRLLRFVDLYSFLTSFADWVDCNEVSAQGRDAVRLIILILEAIVGAENPFLADLELAICIKKMRMCYDDGGFQQGLDKDNNLNPPDAEVDAEDDSKPIDTGYEGLRNELLKRKLTRSVFELMLLDNTIKIEVSKAIARRSQSGQQVRDITAGGDVIVGTDNTITR